MNPNLISINDLSKQDILNLFSLTVQLKSKQQRGIRFTPLSGKSLAMIFYKPSTRTSVSFAVGMHQLGGFPLIFNADDLQLRRGESLADTSRVFSRYVDGILIRASRHEDVLELARHTSIPLINGLTDLEHPCQVITDIYTIMEKVSLRKSGRVPRKVTADFWRTLALEKIRIVYIGDGNNVVNSWLLAASLLGLNFVVCTPRGYEPNTEIIGIAQNRAKKNGARISFTSRPREAVNKADIVYTDVWVSMGQETEKETRTRLFRPYQINPELLKYATPNCMVMHCLPAHRGEEITSAVLDGPQAIVFDQAENRLHVQKAILFKFLSSSKL